MYELTNELKNKILNDLKDMSDYEKKVYYRQWLYEYYKSGYDMELLKIIKFIESQCKVLL